MLTSDEVKTVTDHLATHLGPTGNIRVLIQTVFAPDHTTILLALPDNIPGIGDQAGWLIQYCLTSRWPPDPAKASLLELLLVRLIDIGGVGDLAPLRNRVNSRVDPNDEIFQARWVIGNQPFFDRGNTRQAIRRLLSGVTYPILRINGDVGSGKTYTLELVKHLAVQGPPNVHFTSTSVESKNAASYTIEELAEELTLPMMINEPKPQRSTSAYPKSLALWIIRNTLRQQGVWVLALDGFGDENANPEVRQLAEALSALVLGPETVKKVRLILLDYKPQSPDNLKPRVLDDTLPNPLTVGEQDLHECLIAYNEARRQMGELSKVIEPGEVGPLAASLLGRAPATPAERLRGLNEELLLLWQL
jgi:hypothetical protein